MACALGRCRPVGSRLDTAWTALPAAPGFVPFVDALVNRIVIGEARSPSAEGAPRVEFRTRGADTIGATVFGPDARESDLTPATTALATTALGGKDRVEVRSAARLSGERFSGHAAPTSAACCSCWPCCWLVRSWESRPEPADAARLPTSISSASFPRHAR